MIPDEEAPAPWYSNVQLGAPGARGVPTVTVTDNIPLEACGGEALFCAKANIILVWRDGAYRVAVEQMRHSTSHANTKNAAHSVIQRAVDLIFSGNEPSGWRYLQGSCPQKGECQSVIAELRRNLEKAPYYRAMYPVTRK